MAQGLTALVATVMGAVRIEELFAGCEDSDTLTDKLDRALRQSNVRPRPVLLPAKEAKAALEYALGLDFQGVAGFARDVLEALLCQFWQYLPAPDALQ